MLKLRKEIEKEQSRENALKLKALINNGIIKTIEDNEKAGNITHEDTVILIGLLEKLYTHLYGSIKKFKEEWVKDMLAEKLILETDKIMYERDKLILETGRLIQESEKREEKAKEKTKLEIAKNMLDSGMTVEQVKSLTKLPLGKIKGLQKKK